MKNIAIAILFLILTSQSCNSGYSTYSKVEDVTFAYKWGEANNEEGEKVPAMLLFVGNENSSDIHYRLNVDFYYEGILRESGALSHCVPSGKTRKGKLNGVYLVSEKFTSDQINSSDFKVELNDITVEQIAECKPD